MSRDVMTVVTLMARREAAAALQPALQEETGDQRADVRVTLVPCPTCGADGADRVFAPPFGHGDVWGPELRMLGCEWLTARQVLPAVLAVADRPELAGVPFLSRALTLHSFSHLPDIEALANVDAAERWFDDPGTVSPTDMPVRTLPASTRHYLGTVDWETHVDALTPSFLSPHPTVPTALERHYANVRHAAIADAWRAEVP